MKRSLCVMAVALGVGLGGVMAHAQLPEIYEVVPRAARAGEVLTILGQDFDPVAANNIVHIGGVRARVQGSWVTELDVEVPQAAQEGAITVAVGGRLALSPERFQPLFAPFGESNAVYRRTVILPSFSYATSNHVSIATADLNGDGGAELICAKGDARIDILEYVPGSPLLSTSSFQARAFLNASAGSTNLMVVDFDADGRIDVLATGPNGFDLFRNVHAAGPLIDASFAPRLRVNRTGARQWELADVDRDGRVDVITREAASVSFHLNTYDPDATNQWLSSRIPLTPIFSSDLRHIGVGDLNLDGHVDVVVATIDDLRIFSHNSRSEATNRFTQLTIPQSGLTFVQVIDVDGDGFSEVLTYGTYGSSTRAYDVYWNKNEGGHLEESDFQRVRLAQTDMLSYTPKVLDANGDGFQDMVGPTRAGGFDTGNFYANQSGVIGEVVFAGSFLTSTNILTNAPVMITADLNRDGAQDVITLRNGVTVYQNMASVTARLIGVNVAGDPAIVVVQAIGKPGELLTLQGTANFRFWTDVQTLRVGSGGVVLFDGDVTNTMRFFRLKPSP
jgi:hypothetical protein